PDHRCPRLIASPPCKVSGPRTVAPRYTSRMARATGAGTRPRSISDQMLRVLGVIAEPDLETRPIGVPILQPLLVLVPVPLRRAIAALPVHEVDEVRRQLRLTKSALAQ